jgi:RNA polymerase sigma-70 factor (ECF subfamily)
LKSGRDTGLDAAEVSRSNAPGPAEYAMGCEESDKLHDLLGRLPYEQREVIILHLHHGMRFREIAKAAGVSINTVQSRYRYGLDKLRSIVNGEVTK